MKAALAAGLRCIAVPNPLTVRLEHPTVTLTLGSLVDKLAIVNIKLWHVQEDVYRYSKMSSAEYEGLASDESHTTWQKLAQLNLERSGLIRELDEAFAGAITSGVVPIDARVKIV